MKAVYLRTAREARGLTQTQLGLLAIVAQNTISKLETYPAYQPGFDLALRLARALKIPAERLRFGPDPARHPDKPAPRRGRRGAAAPATPKEITL
jgi:transcriptional regulator with XRE-family HTH domain